MREFFVKANTFIEKMMVVIMPVAVIAGFLLGDRISSMKDTTTWLFAFACFAGSLSLSVSDIGKAFNLKALIALIVLGHVVVPAIATLLFRIVENPSSDFFIGLMLIFTGPCATTSCIWSGIFGGNKGLSVLFVMVDTLLCMLIMPMLIKLTCSTDVAMNLGGMVISMLKMVALPSAIGIAVSTIVGKERLSVVSPYLRFITKISLLFIIMVGIAGSQAAIKHGFSFSYIWSFILIAVVVVLGYLIGYLSNKYVLRDELQNGISLAFGLGCRNIGLAIILANSYFPPLAVVAPVVALFYHDIITSGAGKVFQKILDKKESSNAASRDCEIQ